MAPDPSAVLVDLARLAMVIVVAGGGVWLLLRTTTAPATDERPPLGYPPQRYPATELVREGPLAHLAQIQHRLVLLHAQLPRDSGMSLWLEPFLRELRVVMDRAYDVALVTRLYGRPAALERLATEVARLEQQVADHVTAWMIAPDDSTGEGLETQLMLLRLCVDELAPTRTEHPV